MSDKFFTPTGNFVARGADNVNPALVDILDEAANRAGMKVEAYSGYRPGDPRFHGKGMATDVRIIGADGKAIPNYQSAEGFSQYEKLAQEARKVQQEKYPSLDQNFRWGGYFGGPKGKYGAMDLMHFDLGGSAKLGMAGGSWDKGLNDRQAALFGMTNYKAKGLENLAVPPQNRSVQVASTFDPTAFGAVPLDAPAAAASAAPATPDAAQASFAPDQPVAPAVGALNNLVQPVAAKPGYQVVPNSQPVPLPPAQPAAPSPIAAGDGHGQQPAFDPVAAGAVPFDPTQFGAVEVNTKVDPKTMQPPSAGPDAIPAYQPPGVTGYDQQTGEVTRTAPMDKVGAFLAGVSDLPVIGPAIHEGQRDIAAGLVAPFTDVPYGQIREEMGTDRAQAMRDNPGTTLAGNVAGTLATIIPAAATTIGGFALGATGSLGTRMGMSAASNGIMSTADTAVRGGTLADVIKNGLTGAGIGGALPGAGAIVNGIGRAVVDTVGPRVNALVRPAYEGARRVGQALGIDAKNTAAPVLNATDEAAAAANGQNLLNVDRGGEMTRALARSAANQDPEARAIIDKTVSDRFASQGDRAQSFISRLMGGATDDLALQDSLQAAADASNAPAYKKAFSAAGAQDMFSPGLKDLLAAPAIREAAKDAETRGANRAVVEGFNPVKNPFTFDEAGQATLRTDAKPTLQFWDQVKRNLDAEMGKAKIAGDKTMVSDLKALKTKLVGELDQAVPEYATARQGAAAFFGAENALEAGKKFVTQNRTIPETRRALAKMTPAERSTFAVGFASELKDSIAQSGDRTNVINKIFGSQQARDKIEAALGQKAYGQFEQFVRVEHSMDMLRGAMGNSTTARQLMEMGLAGGVGGGTALYTGDYRKGITAAVLTGLARRGGAMVDEKVTKRVAELLLSGDPKALQQAVTIASNSPKAAAAVSAIQNALSMATKAGGNLATRPDLNGNAPLSGPLDLTVTKPGN